MIDENKPNSDFDAFTKDTQKPPQPSMILRALKFKQLSQNLQTKPPVTPSAPPQANSVRATGRSPLPEKSPPPEEPIAIPVVEEKPILEEKPPTEIPPVFSENSTLDLTPVALAPSEPVALAPSEPVALAPSEPVALAPSEPVALAPSEPVALAPSEPVSPTETKTPELASAGEMISEAMLKAVEERISSETKLAKEKLLESELALEKTEAPEEKAVAFETIAQEAKLAETRRTEEQATLLLRENLKKIAEEKAVGEVASSADGAKLLAEKTIADVKARLEDEKQQKILHSVEKLIETPVEKSIETPVEKPIETPVEKPIETPVEKPIETPVEKPIETPVEKPIETPIEKPIETPVEKPIETPVEKPIFSEVSEKSVPSETLQNEIEENQEKALTENPPNQTQTITWEEANQSSPEKQSPMLEEEVTQVSEIPNVDSITHAVSPSTKDDPNMTRNVDFKAEIPNVSASSVGNLVVNSLEENDGQTRVADWDDGQTKVADLENDVTKIAGQQMAPPMNLSPQDQKDTSNALLSPNDISKVQNQFESEVDSIIDINKKRTRPIVELETLVGETLIEQTLLRVEAKIAEGGMGSIYRAKMVFADGVEKAVALKTLKPQFTNNPELLSMFINEARLMAELTHHNVVTMLTFGKFQGLYFYAMEYVEGRDLNEFHARHKKLNRPTPIGHICYIISQVCAALYYIHNKKDNRGKPLELIHRDISPHNIMFSKDGVVKLMDFGVAKGKSIAKSQSKPFAGKLNYIAPEMALSKEVDHRSDIYSLGIVFYEVLTGQVPLRWRNHVELIFGVEKAEIKPPSTLRSDIPPEIERIIMTAVSKKPEDRFPDAASMGFAVNHFLYAKNLRLNESTLSACLKGVFVNLAQSGIETSKQEDLVDMALAQSAIKQGYVKPDQLMENLRQQAELASDEKYMNLGAILVQNNLLTIVQFLELLKEQNLTVMRCTSCMNQYYVKLSKINRENRCLRCRDPLEVPAVLQSAVVDGKL